MTICETQTYSARADTPASLSILNRKDQKTKILFGNIAIQVKAKLFQIEQDSQIDGLLRRYA